MNSTELFTAGIDTARENGRLEVETAVLRWLERHFTIIPTAARNELLAVLRPSAERKEL